MKIFLRTFFNYLLQSWILTFCLGKTLKQCKNLLCVPRRAKVLRTIAFDDIFENARVDSVSQVRRLASVVNILHGLSLPKGWQLAKGFCDESVGGFSTINNSGLKRGGYLLLKILTVDFG